MHITMKILGAATVALLAGCIAETQPEIEAEIETETARLCAAADHADLEGQPATAAEALPHPKRIIPPGSAVTMDHLPSRINVDLDEAGKIIRIWCG